MVEDTNVTDTFSNPPPADTSSWTDTLKSLANTLGTVYSGVATTQAANSAKKTAAKTAAASGSNSTLIIGVIAVAVVGVILAVVLGRRN